MKPKDRLLSDVSRSEATMCSQLQHHFWLFWRQGSSCVVALTIRTQTDRYRGQWVPEFGFILQYRNHLEPFRDRHHWSRGSVKSILHCSLVHWRSHTWDTKDASTFYLLFYDKFLSPSLDNFIRLKHHILASSKQIPKSGVWLEVYAHINQTFGSGIWALP